MEFIVLRCYVLKFKDIVLCMYVSILRLFKIFVVIIVKWNILEILKSKYIKSVVDVLSKCCVLID